MANVKQLKITQIRSSIGKLVAQKRTIKALGLKKMHATVVHKDTPAIRGHDCVCSAPGQSRRSVTREKNNNTELIDAEIK